LIKAEPFFNPQSEIRRSAMLTSQPSFDDLNSTLAAGGFRR
jgi:hypothetical protein